jgi:hypothetical protein
MGERGRSIETFFAIRPSPAIALNATDKSLTNAVAMWRSLFEPSHPRHWTYMPYDLPPDAAASQTWIGSLAASRDPMFHVIIDLETGSAVG